MKTNNLYKPVSYKIVIVALLVTLIVLAPQILKLIVPNNELLTSITEGSGWYLYLVIVGITIAVIEYKVKHLKKDSEN